MTTIVEKLGNDQDLFISKIIWDALKVSDKEKVEIVFQNNELRIRKAASTKHKSIEERLESYYNKNIDEILSQSDIQLDQEYDWGKPMGKEL